MWERRRFRAAVVLAMIALFIGAVVPSVSATGERPSWHVGDYWEYSGWQSSPVGGPYRHRIEVEAIEPVDAGGLSHETYRLMDTWTFPSGGFAPIRMWQATGDLSTVKIENSLPIMFLGFCSTGRCSSTYGPPIPVYEFPLAQGKRWMATSTRTVQSDSGTWNDTITVSMEVFAERNLSVLLNESGQLVPRTFHTFEIALTSLRIGDDLITYSPAALVLNYADEVGLWVRVAEYYSEGTMAGEYNLTGFRYTQPPPLASSPWLLIGFVAIAAGSAMVVVLYRWRQSRDRGRQRNR